MFCCMLLYVLSSIAIILMGKRELVALLNLSSWCLVMVEQLFLAMPWGCLRFVIVVFPDHTHLLFLHCLPLSHKKDARLIWVNMIIDCIVHVTDQYVFHPILGKTILKSFRQN